MHNYENEKCETFGKKKVLFATLIGVLGNTIAGVIFGIVFFWEYFKNNNDSWYIFLSLVLAVAHSSLAVIGSIFLRIFWSK